MDRIYQINNDTYIEYTNSLGYQILNNMNNVNINDSKIISGDKYLLNDILTKNDYYIKNDEIYLTDSGKNKYIVKELSNKIKYDKYKTRYLLGKVCVKLNKN